MYLLNNKFFALIAGASLGVRLWLSSKMPFNNDELVLYHVGKKFYDTGEIPAEGIRLVYNNQAIPGSLLGILSGLPLFFSEGEPIGLALWIGFLNWLAVLLMFLWFRSLVSIQYRSVLAGWLFFAPWTILFTTPWNPSYLPLFSVPFFWILYKYRNGNFTFLSSVCLGALFIFNFQIHLSVVLLGFALVIVFFNAKNKRTFVFGGLIGALISSVMLIPWLKQLWLGQNSAPTGVVQVNLSNVLDYPKAFLRYLSFPTAEVTRFVTYPGLGFGGFLKLLGQNVSLIPFAVVSLVTSVFMVFLFAKRLVGLFRKRKNLDAFEKLELYMPIVMPLTFGFSLKSSSAHTFWILMHYHFILCLKR